MRVRGPADGIRLGQGDTWAHTCCRRLHDRRYTNGTGMGEVTVFEAGDIREWRGHDVVDPDSHKIGELESIYVDTTSDQAVFATVTVGMPTHHRLVFVPLAGATVGPGYLMVGYDKSQVKDAPSIGVDGVLPAEDEPEIFRHYGLEYPQRASSERQLARR